MVIKILFLILCLPIMAWAKPAGRKKSGEEYFKRYQEQADAILHSKGIPSSETLKAFDATEATLAELEYEEDKVDEISEKVDHHIKAEEAKVYTSHFFAFADYISWQQDFSLKTPSGKKNLIATNKGYCAGGGYGYQNAKYHFFADGCFLYFRGDAAAQKTTVTYHQSDVYGYGLKASLGAGMYVSSAKAEVGFKIPVMYSNQNFDDPNQASFPGTKVSQPNSVNSFASLYTRWPFDRWFFQTEFGKRLDKDLTLWSLGLGYKF